MEKIKIGKIVNAVGLKGEVKVYSYAGENDRFEKLDRIIAGGSQSGSGQSGSGQEGGAKRAACKKPQSDMEFEIEKVRYQKNMVILKLRGVDDRNQAEALKDMDVFITEDDLEELPDDTFYVRDLIGCQVVDINDGKKLGVVSDLIQNSAQDIYQIDLAEGGQTLIPAVEQFIKNVDIENKTITVSLIPGLID
jgi:16S rRNA processing protein RimM